MGGRVKPDLRAPDSGERIVERWLRLARERSLACVLVGSHPEMAPLAPAPRRLDDAPAGVGPLGGLRALLIAAQGPAIALGGDMPFVTGPLLERLATQASSAAVLAARDAETGRWQPCFARYDAARVLPVLDGLLREGGRSFQALFARLDVEEMLLTDEEQAQLRDWDTPADMQR